jgi:hypothetical protein
MSRVADLLRLALPQFGVPQNVHPSGPPSMSIEPQKRWLIAV